MLHVKQWCKWFPADASQEKTADSRTGGNLGNVKCSRPSGVRDQTSRFPTDRQARPKRHQKKSQAIAQHITEAREPTRTDHTLGSKPAFPGCLENRLDTDALEIDDSLARTQQWVQQCIQQEPWTTGEEDNGKTSERGDTSCCICHTGYPNHALYPCGHQCLCAQCKISFIKNFKWCPICNQDFVDVIRIYRI